MGSTAIAYHPADEATARSIARSWKGRAKTPSYSHLAIKSISSGHRIAQSSIGRSHISIKWITKSSGVRRVFLLVLLGPVAVWLGWKQKPIVYVVYLTLFGLPLYAVTSTLFPEPFHPGQYDDAIVWLMFGLVFGGVLFVLYGLELVFGGLDQGPKKQRKERKQRK